VRGADEIVVGDTESRSKRQTATGHNRERVRTKTIGRCNVGVGLIRDQRYRADPDARMSIPYLQYSFDYR
jgi:hypothetical protein